jgi:acyl-CoA thioester hydrolase
MGDLSAGGRAYSTRWRVRTYELDHNGHVNNAVYLNWAEQVATEHTEATGFGSAWAAERQGVWVVRRQEITYHRPALYGDELELTTSAEGIKGARGHRRTSIVRLADGVLVAEVLAEWVWVQLPEGRPTRVPEELVSFFSQGE